MSTRSDRLTDADCAAIAEIVARARQRLAQQAAGQPSPAADGGAPPSAKTPRRRGKRSGGGRDAPD